MQIRRRRLAGFAYQLDENPAKCAKQISDCADLRLVFRTIPDIPEFWPQAAPGFVRQRYTGDSIHVWKILSTKEW